MLKSKNNSFLKADFHLHTHEDLYDSWIVKYSAKDLIRLAAKQKFEVLSITNHMSVFFNQLIKGFAKKKGILLIPGAEARIQGKDVLIINITNDELAKIKKFDDLEKIKDSALIIAPHPFFLTGHCLDTKLVKHIDKFHAVEFSHFYTKALINPFFKFIAGNPRAVAIAEKYHKPIIGTSDAHKLYELGSTFTWIDSSKNKDAVIDAVKRNRIRIETNPMPTYLFFRRMFGAFIKEGVMKQTILRKSIEKRKKAALQKI